MLQDLVTKFTASSDALFTITAGLTREQLISFPVPGTWSLQQLAIHLLDSDLVATHRMKRIIAEDAPLLISYDETAFARSLHYHELSLPTACDLFRLNRLHMGEILRRLPDSTFDRHGIHSQRGKVTLRDMVEIYIHHIDHHMPFAIAKRAKLGVPMAP